MTLSPKDIIIRSKAHTILAFLNVRSVRLRDERIFRFFKGSSPGETSLEDESLTPLDTQGSILGTTFAEEAHSCSCGYHMIPFKGRRLKSILGSSGESSLEDEFSTPRFTQGSVLGTYMTKPYKFINNTVHTHNTMFV